MGEKLIVMAPEPDLNPAAFEPARVGKSLRLSLIRVLLWTNPLAPGRPIALPVNGRAYGSLKTHFQLTFEGSCASLLSGWKGTKLELEFEF